MALFIVGLERSRKSREGWTGGGGVDINVECEGMGSGSRLRLDRGMGDDAADDMSTFESAT